MRSLRIRPIAHSVKILTVGAFLAAGTAGCVLPGASAADGWTAIVPEDTNFHCVSECKAGGAGDVSRGAVAVPALAIPPNKSIDAWKRTVVIHCKSATSDVTLRRYQATVKDKNWEGIWEIERYFLDKEQTIDDSTFPVCS